MSASTASAPPRKKLLNELKRVCEQLKKMPREFTSLDLTHINLNDINKESRKRFGEFAKLSELTLNQCGITSLKDLPLFPQLRSLSLIGNQIPDSEVIYLAQYPKLSKLVLIDNNIKQLSVFAALSKIKNLQHLQLEGNDLTYLFDSQVIKEQAFKRIHSLKSLDGRDIDGEYYVSPSDHSDQIEVEQDEDSNQGEIEVKEKKTRKHVKRENYAYS